MSKNNIFNTKGKASTPNYGKVSFKDKLLKRLRSEFTGFIANTPLQFKIYPAYWHYYFERKKLKNNLMQLRGNLYLTQKPNYGAGIGHQLANWNSGFYFSQYFGTGFAHTPFSSPKWDELLGWGEGEVLALDLIESSEYSKVRLPGFDSTNSQQIELLQSIIDSYNGRKVLFQFEIDQGYSRQCDTAIQLSDKFFRAKSRSKDQLIFEANNYNIAIHIRRRMKIESEEVWKKRGLDNSYFAEILSAVLFVMRTNKKICIYLFSQGSQEDFPEFASFKNFHFCMDMNPYDSFLHMVYADMLISSKSSFSYKPALISKGIKICPETFWHQYPSRHDFILADNNGKFDNNQLFELMGK